MAEFVLKNYQRAALDSLATFLRAARMRGPKSAFEGSGYGYRSEPFGEVPCVCLRIPTGGGKTLLASHAIVRIAKEWMGSDAPTALWLTPSETIRAQTLSALQTPGHPYRAALEAAYGQAFQICDLESVSAVPPQDFGRQAVVVVATIQSFRIENPDQRNVYAFAESFEPHFRGMIPQRLAVLRELPDGMVTEQDTADPHSPLKGHVGQPKFSLANWLALQHPVVIVDEAHNTKTERSFEALKRLNPSMILELTATPIPKKTNVLYHVSAQELQAEDMVKLPIALMEHPQGWDAAVFDAVQTQRRLEAVAQKEGDYIRPIVLFQAQNAAQLVNVQALRKHLIEELHIPEAQIAVATGETRELEDARLDAPDCPIRFIITVQALREGWDCPFAYVLCALAAGRNPAAVTQLVGRILRQPNVTRTWRAPLDESYVFCHDAQTGEVVTSIKKSLEIEGMGDLTASVRTTGGTNGDGGKIKHIGRRAGLGQLRIFLPRVTWREGDSRRELVYECDVLGNLPWEELDAALLAAGWKPAVEAPQEQRFRIDLGILSPTGNIAPTDEGQGPVVLDRVFVARAIGDLVPNSWLAFDLVEQVVGRLLKVGCSEAMIASSSARLVEQLRADVVVQRDAMAQRVFEQKVQSGDIEFRLRADRFDYEIPRELEIELPEKPVPLLSGAKLLEKSLFDPFYESMVDNDFEGEFACYLDSQAALVWWHRNVARAHYGLQGWRRDRVYPDFVFLRTARAGKPVLVVMETKGAHLKNEDTDYKKNLLATLTEAYSSARFKRAGELELAADDGPRIVCDLVFDENWRNALNSRHFAVDSG
ncbi:MAG: DEAD/DEAH box helicase family protein [Betaproteobacteria bacterium]|nr:DEAD/DEAH box helicase family protein [Betaproteobacteria bacterium]